MVKYNSYRTKLHDLKPAFLQCCTFTYFQIQITIAFVLGNLYSLEIRSKTRDVFFFGLHNRIVINSTFPGFDISQNDMNENAHK